MNSYRGFSLIEMLVAMVILSLSLGVLYQAAAGATRNVGVAAEYTEAMILAESLISEADYVTEVGAGSQGAFAEYRWQIETFPVILQSAEVAVPSGAELAEVRVSVFWGAPPRERQVVLTTYSPVVAIAQ